MYELFLALFLAFACPAQNNKSHQQHNNSQVTTMDDTEGEGSHIPPGANASTKTNM